MQTYELTYIVSPEVSSQEAEEKAKELESAIQSKEGIILKQSNPVAKTLAFPVAKRASGFLGILEFQLEPEKLIELKETIRKDGKILRHMVIIKETSKPRKARRTKPVSPELSVFETKTPAYAEGSGPLRQSSSEASEAKEEKQKEKVELKDIEQQLDELLG